MNSINHKAIKRQQYTISKELFISITGINVMFIELVGRKNSKRIRYVPNYIKSHTMSIDEFIQKCRDWLIRTNSYTYVKPINSYNVQSLFGLCQHILDLRNEHYL